MGCTLSLHIQPGASSTMVSGLHGDRLKIKVKGEAKDNEANECLREFLSEIFGISKKKVEILRGESSRQKEVLVELSPEDVILLLKLG